MWHSQSDQYISPSPQIDPAPPVASERPHIPTADTSHLSPSAASVTLPLLLIRTFTYESLTYVAWRVPMSPVQFISSGPLESWSPRSRQVAWLRSLWRREKWILRVNQILRDPQP